MELHTWLAFFVACWLISLSPGAGAVASMSSGLQYGFLRSFWNTVGLQIGLMVQLAIVAAGVGALLAASATAFALIKWFGVLYLIYLAYKQWRAAPAELAATEDGIRPLGNPLVMIFRGFLVNISNPKAIIFLLAVVPQFINPQAPLLSQYLILGGTMIVVDVVVMGCYSGLAANVLRLLRSPRQQRILNRVFAGLFLLAATVLATVRRTPA